MQERRRVPPHPPGRSHRSVRKSLCSRPSRRRKQRCLPGSRSPRAGRCVPAALGARPDCESPCRPRRTAPCSLRQGGARRALLSLRERPGSAVDPAGRRVGYLRDTATPAARGPGPLPRGGVCAPAAGLLSLWPDLWGPTANADLPSGPTARDRGNQVSGGRAYFREGPLRPFAHLPPPPEHPACSGDAEHAVTHVLPATPPSRHRAQVPVTAQNHRERVGHGASSP